MTGHKINYWNQQVTAVTIAADHEAGYKPISLRVALARQAASNSAGGGWVWDAAVAVALAGAAGQMALYWAILHERPHGAPAPARFAVPPEAK